MWRTDRTWSDQRPKGLTRPRAQRRFESWGRNQGWTTSAVTKATLVPSRPHEARTRRRTSSGASMLPRKPQLSTHLEDHDPDAVTTSSPLSAGSSAVPINMSGSGAGPISPSEARAGSTQGPSSRGYFSPPSRPVGAGGPRSASHGRPTSATHSHRGSPIHSPSTMSSPGTTSPHGHPLSRSSSRASEATLSPIMYPIDDDRSTGSSRPSSATVSRHPSFSFHGLEGKGSTGVAGDRPDYSEAKIVVAMVRAVPVDPGPDGAAEAPM